MIEKAENLELLSAYVCGDVTPDERAAVERLLGSEPSARALAQELRHVSDTLKLGRKPVRAELLEALRQRVQEQTAARAGELSIEALLSASLSGDLDARERDLLNKHLDKYPHVRAELAALSQLSTSLTQARQPVSDAFSKKLAERLNAKLPAAAQVGAAARKIETMKVSTKTQAERPSLRVYAQPENPWRRVAWAGAAVAALVAVAIGVSRVNQTPANTNQIVKTSDPVKEPAPVAHKDVRPENQNVTRDNNAQQPPKAPDIVVERKPAPETPNQELIANPQPKINPVPEQRDVPKPNTVDVVQNPEKPVAPPKLNRDLPPELSPRPQPDVVIVQPGENTPPVKAVAETKPTVDPKSPADPKTTVPTKDVATTKTDPIRPPELPTVDTTPGFAQRSGTGFATPEKATTSEPPAVKNVPADAIEVTMVKDGNVQVSTKGTQSHTIQSGTVIPSGSTIIADAGRVALSLPGNARLWVNRGSRLELTLNGSNAAITLTSGEISYDAQGNGTVTVTTELATITRANGVDVRAENGRVTAYASRKPVKMSTKSGKSETLANGEQAIVTGAAAPAKSTFTGQPDAWGNDLHVEVSNDKNAAGGKNRGSRGRK